MKYVIEGKNMPVLTIDLNAGEQVFAQSGALSWMSPTIEMKAQMKDGLLKSVGRMFGGESLFQTVYTATTNGQLTLSPKSIGTVYAVDLTNRPAIIVQKRSFLAAQMGIDQSVVFTRKFAAGLFGGEGFILQRFAGSGMLFLESMGEIVEKTLADKETLLVDNGHVVAFDESVAYDIRLVKGLGNMLFSGEGVTLVELRGPGKVLLQSLSESGLASIMHGFLPHK